MANPSSLRVLLILGWACYGVGAALVFSQLGFDFVVAFTLLVGVGPVAAMFPRGVIQSRLIGFYCGLVAILAAYPFIWGVSLSSLGAVLSILGTFALLMSTAIKHRPKQV